MRHTKNYHDIFQKNDSDISQRDKKLFELGKNMATSAQNKVTEAPIVRSIETQTYSIDMDQTDRVKTKKVLKPKAFVSSTLNSHDYFSLPIITLDFKGLKVKALLDTGSSISLIQSHIIQEIKNKIKIKYLSHNLKIQTINHNSIPYFAAASLTLKNEQKWRKGIFFIMNHVWNTL